MLDTSKTKLQSKMTALRISIFQNTAYARIAWKSEGLDHGGICDFGLGQQVIYQRVSEDGLQKCDKAHGVHR